MAATSLIYRARLDEARSRIAEMSRSSDPDLRACAAWMPVEMTEMEIALSDGEGELLARMEREIDALEAFGEKHADIGQRFEDLILEAKLRRVYLLVRQGERTAAIRALQEGRRLLEQRRRVKQVTPTYIYAEAMANLAVAHADWPVRMVLRLVGITGDPQRGKKAADLILSKSSVYRPGVTCVIRSFAAEKSGVLGPPVDLSRKLHREFPENPVLAVDLAIDLAAARGCEEVRHTLEPWRTRSMSTRMRSAVNGLLTTCAEQQAMR